MDPIAANHGRKYKSRKERPCDACRRRKVCCIREPGDEACSLCRMQKSLCTYDKAPTPRRRRPISTTALTAGESEFTVSGTPSGVVPLAALPTSATTNATNAASISPNAAGQMAQPVGEWISQFVGLSVDQDPFVLRHCNFGHSNYYRSGDWACLRVRSDGVVPSHFTLVPDDHLDARPPYYPASNLLDAAYPFHHELLSTYFEVIHTSYPLLEPSRFTKGNKIDLPLLASMYALAAPFCSAAAEVSRDVIHSFIFQAMPIEAKAPRLETIEAGLLFLQRHNSIHRAPPMPGMYPEIGQLVGMCHDAGLNVDPSHWDLSLADRSRRKRLWWGIYIHDKWAALGLGRPSYIHEDDCNVPLPTIEDIPSKTIADHQLPRTSALMFVAMAALTQILSSVLTTFYTLRSMEQMARVSSDELGHFLDYFDQQLKTFNDEYMSPLQIVKDVFLDPTGTLVLAYHTVELVLYRAILRYLPPTDSLCAQLRTRSKLAVASVSQMLENLQVTRLRAFWWSPISRINFSMAGGFMFSMLLSSAADEDIDYWSAEISRYRRLLDMQSLSFDTTKLASARMSLLAAVSHGGRPVSAAGRVDPKQAFCRDFGVELNTL